MRKLRLDQRQSRHPAHIVITSPVLSINIGEKNNPAGGENNNDNIKRAAATETTTKKAQQRLSERELPGEQKDCLEIVWQRPEPSTWRLN